jgi:hypothetical protein
MPQIKIVWSQILPRFSWRYSDNFEAMERSRRRLNNCIASCVLKSGGIVGFGISLKYSILLTSIFPFLKYSRQFYFRASNVTAKIAKIKLPRKLPGLQLYDPKYYHDFHGATQIISRQWKEAGAD